jgi:hypothetical protein
MGLVGLRKAGTTGFRDGEMRTDTLQGPQWTVDYVAVWLCGCEAVSCLTSTSSFTTNPHTNRK